MIQSSILKLDKAEICKLNFETDLSVSFKGIKPEDISFNFCPSDNKKDKTKKRMLFRIYTNKSKLGVNFDIIVGYEYSFFNEKKIDDEISIGVSAVFPQIISFIRGVLFLISNCTPYPILLPSIDVIKSFKIFMKGMSMKLNVYETKKKDEYIIVKKGTEKSKLPTNIQKMIGESFPWKTLEVTEGEHRIGLDSTQAISNIQKSGYHIQKVEIKNNIFEKKN